MVRVFLAAPIPSKTKELLGKQIGKIREKLPDWEVNWEVPKNLHITLIFFGWITKKQIIQTQREIETTIKNFPSFEVAAGNLSFHQNHPIWFEIENGKGELNQIYQLLKKKLSIKGSTTEKRTFHPHLTIGRVKNRGKAHKTPETGKLFSWEVDKLVLYESKLSREGSTYTELALFPLKAGGR